MVKAYRGARTSVWIMEKNFVIVLTCFFIVMCCSICNMEKVRFVSTERPVIIYQNTKHMSYLNSSALRFGRRDPVYYTSMYFVMVHSFGNNVTLNFYFYELMSNMRFRLFFELHYKLCDLLHKDKFLGPILKQGKFDAPCPYAAGDYFLTNMTMPIALIPPVLPFTKGRIYLNITVTSTHEVIAAGYVDMEIKTMKRGASIHE